ncbi:MAG TPA: histone [Candidatus Nanoarchaeia archaeon]|nr:histone [Candidatus Nanoarchaeia archaeon]
MTDKILALSAMEKLLKEGGCERVGEDAKKALKLILEEKARQITIKAIAYAQHAKRKTIKAEDIRLAIKD